MRLLLPTIFAALKPRRRWLQFSLRTLFVLLTVLCVFCAWLKVTVERARKQREAVSALKTAGAIVHYDFDYDRFGKRIAQPKAPGPAWARKFLGDDFFASVFRVYFSDTSRNPSFIGGQPAFPAITETMYRKIKQYGLK